MYLITKLVARMKKEKFTMCCLAEIPFIAIAFENAAGACVVLKTQKEYDDFTEKAMHAERMMMLANERAQGVILRKMDDYALDSPELKILSKRYEYLKKTDFERNVMNDPEITAWTTRLVLKIKEEDEKQN